MLQHIGPLMVLSATGQGQSLALCFFEYVSIKHINEFRPCDTWRKTLMFYSQTVPAVRYAATALALVHRDHLDCGTTDQVYQLQASKVRPSSEAPLVQYNRAIQLLLNLEGDDSIEKTAITLLVCYLFMSFDLLAGNYVEATRHLRGGVELARKTQQVMTQKGITHGAYSLLGQVTEQIRRLDMQAVTFLIDWNPLITRESLISWMPAPDLAFASLDQAADHMQTLVSRIIRLRYRNHPPEGETPISVSLMQATTKAQLERWRRLFDAMLRQDGSLLGDAESQPLIPLLELQYTVAWTLLDAPHEKSEMEFDDFLPQFQHAMVLARKVAAVHTRYSGSTKPTFTPEIGFVPVLYVIGAKCRDPVVRREAVSLLRQQPIREAVWDSVLSAIVLERMIEVEECGPDQGQRVESMEQISLERRIENTSWMHLPGALSSLELTYTMCGSDEVRTESIAI